MQGTSLVEFDSRRYASGTYINELQVDGVVIDRLGEVIFKEESGLDLPYPVDLSGNSKGVYFVKVLNGEEMFLDKIIYQ